MRLNRLIGGGGEQSLFDGITEDCLLMAFFPCIYFESMQMTYYQGYSNNLRHLKGKKKFDVILDRIKNREYFYSLLYKLICVCELRGIRLVIENPATPPHYLMFPQNFFKPSMIDSNRTLRGDFFRKPTAYWFFNCEPTRGNSYQKPACTKTVRECKQGARAGLCSEERSMISPDYARNFICDFIIGKDQGLDRQLKLF